MREFFGVVLLTVLTSTCFAHNNSTFGNSTTPSCNNCLYVGGFFNLNTQEGWSILAMAQMAINEINNSTTLLPAHKLQLVVESTQGVVRYGPQVFHTLMNDGKTKIMLLGPVDDLLASSIASYAGLPQYRLLQFSPRTTSLELANYRNLYPYFFRTQTSMSYFDLPRIEILKHFKWEEVGLIYGDHHIYYELTQQFKARLNMNRITVLADVRLQSNDPARPVRTMLSKDVHVILGLFNFDSTTRKMFCEAYKRGMYGPHYVWMLVMSYNGWWVPGASEMLECTIFEMNCQLQNHIYFRGTTELPDGSTKNQAGKNFSMILKDYYTRVDNGNVTSNRSDQYTAFQVYDAVYSIANVLHNSAERFSGALKHVQYGNKNTSELFYNETLKLDFFSPYLGNVRFYSNGDRKYDIHLFQLVINNDGRPTGKALAKFDVTKSTFIPSLSEIRFKWLAGVPYSKTTEIFSYPTIHPTLFAIMTFFVCIGLIYALLCFALLVTRFSERTTKKSGPIINLVIILGCMLNYITVILYGLDYGLVPSSTMTNICRARAWTFALGFTLSIGGLFAKLWIAYCVLTKRFVKKKISMLVWMVAILTVLFLADIVILSFWEARNPLYRTLIRYRDQPHYQCGGKITEDTFRANIAVVEHCFSTNLSSWLIVVLLVKGIVVLFGTFMAWQTRKVFIRALNDTQHCAFCMISICVSSVIGLILALTLNRYPNVYFGFIGSLTFLSTTIILLWLFAHKIARLQCKPKKVKTIHVGGPLKNSRCASFCGNCAGPAACFLTWFCCLPCCNPYTCCRSCCCGSQVYPESVDRSHHHREAEFYIAGKGQNKDAEIILLKQTIEAKNEELKLLRGKHGTVNQAATQTDDWIANVYYGSVGGLNSDDESGFENNRYGNRRDSNKFKVFNERLDFSHIKSKIDSGVAKPPSRRRSSNENETSEQVRRNSRQVWTNRTVKQDEEILKLKQILAQKEKEIQRLKDDLESFPQSQISLRHAQDQTEGKNWDSEKRKQFQVNSSFKPEAKQLTKRISNSFVRDTFNSEEETLPKSERANFKDTSNNANDNIHDHGEKQTRPNVPSFEEARVVGKDTLKDNHQTKITGNKKGINDKKDHSPTEKDIFLEKETQSNQLQESNNADWLGLSDFTTTKEIDQTEETILSDDSGTINTGKHEKGNSPEAVNTFPKKDISWKKLSKDDLNIKENSATLPSECDVLEKGQQEKQSHFDNEGVDEKKDRNNFIDYMNDELNNDDKKDFDEDFEIDPIDEENEEEEDESGQEDNKKRERHESLNSNRSYNGARQRQMRIPGGKLNWKAESKVNSASGYKPRRSQKKIKTYKVDYRNTKSRLYSSSTKIDSVREESKAESSTSSRVRKSFSGLDQPNVRPNLYESSPSSFSNGGK